MDEPVDGGQRHGLVGEDAAPVAERLVGRDQQGSSFVPGSNQFKQDACFRLVLGNVGEVIE